MSDPVDYTMALATVNDLKTTMAGLARGIISALKDGNMSTVEKLMLGMKGMSLAVSLTSLIQDSTPEERAMVLYVLEQGNITMARV